MKQAILPLASLLSLLLISQSYAQDILKLKNGDELKVKVQEITPTEIKYKRFDNLDGPLITILKNSAASLQYQNGTTEKLIEDIPVVSYVAPVETKTTDNDQVSAIAQFTQFDVLDLVSTEYQGQTYQGKIAAVNRRRETAVVDLDVDGKLRRVDRKLYELTFIQKGKPVTEPIPVVGLVNGQANSSNLFFKGQADAKQYYNGYHGAGTGTFLTTFLGGLVLGLIPAAACSSTPPEPQRLGIPDPQLAKDPNYYTGYTQEAHRIKSRKVWGNFGAGALAAIGVILALSSSYR